MLEDDKLLLLEH